MALVYTEGCFSWVLSSEQVRKKLAFMKMQGLLSETLVNIHLCKQMGFVAISKVQDKDSGIDIY